MRTLDRETTQNSIVRRKSARYEPEFQQSEKLKLSEPKHKKWRRWDELSMACHITLYIFMLFLVYTLCFQLFLHMSANVYEL